MFIINNTFLEILVNKAYDSFPYGILIGCLSSLVALIVFIIIIKKDTFKNLCKKAITLKTLKYGAIAALCMMGFSIVYNNLAVEIFNLDSVGNANQEAVTEMIKSMIKNAPGKHYRDDVNSWSDENVYIIK